MSGAAIAEIVNTVNLYPLAVDTRQWALFDAVFTPDVHADFGGPAVWTALEPLREAFAAIHAPFEATQHATRGHHVRLEACGARANCLSYVHARFLRRIDGALAMFESSGWYDDGLVHTAAGWRLQRRVCRMLWSGGDARVMASAPAVDAEPAFDSLQAEAAAGRIAHVEALLGGA